MDIQIGDRIVFRAVTRHSDKSVTRKVNGFCNGRPTVRFHGWGNFQVRHDEISEVLEDRDPALTLQREVRR